MKKRENYSIAVLSCTDVIRTKYCGRHGLYCVIKQNLSGSCISFHHTPEVSQQPIAPTDKDNQMVQMAFRDFDLKRLDDSEKEFTLSIERWRELARPRDEMASLLKSRANVRLDNKKFEAAISDYDQCLKIMSDGETADGRGRYPEYTDTFVGRGLAKEGLADWKGAVEDYDKAITLWGGEPSTQRPIGKAFVLKDYDGINPYTLTFRGNSLSRLVSYIL